MTIWLLCSGPKQVCLLRRASDCAIIGPVAAAARRTTRGRRHD